MADDSTIGPTRDLVVTYVFDAPVEPVRKSWTDPEHAIFEQYDEGPVVTDEKGIATFEGGARVTYVKDQDSNTLAIAQAPRS